MTKKLPLTQFLIATIAACGLSATTQAATQCTQGDMVRSVEVIYSTPGQSVPCEVLYDKPSEGERETLWRANNQVGYCEEKAAEMVARLESWGWQCAAASTSDIDSANDAAETEPAE